MTIYPKCPVTDKRATPGFCHLCKKEHRPFQKLMPSEAFQAWFKVAMQHVPIIGSSLRNAGWKLPLDGPVHVTALFYRHADVGDLLGYEQALGDWLQQTLLKCVTPGCKSPQWPLHERAVCLNCNAPGKQSRAGADLIRDDSQIESWDGSRNLVDSKRPRIEVTLTVLDPPGQLDLLAEEATTNG